MKLSYATIAPAILLLFGTLAQAQFRDPPRYDPDSVSTLIERVHVDLDQATAPGTSRGEIGTA